MLDLVAFGAVATRNARTMTPVDEELASWPRPPDRTVTTESDAGQVRGAALRQY